MENYIRDDENEKWKESREGRKQLNPERINVLNAPKSRRDDIKRQKKVASHVKNRDRCTISRDHHKAVAQPHGITHRWVF